MGTKVLGNGSQGILFVISAPAGTGKTTLVNMLSDEFDSVVISVSATTRPPRLGEEDGKDYFFLSDAEFEKRLKEGDFLEHAQVFGYHYGTSQGFVQGELAKGKHVVLVIDTQGAMQLKGKIDATFIFIRPPNLEELRERLLKRKTESLQVIEERLSWAKKELEMAVHYDFLIVNDNLHVAYAVLRSVLIAKEHEVI